MQVKVSDIIISPSLKGSYIKNEKYYSNNLIDKIEVIENLEIIPLTSNLYIIHDNLKINDEDFFIDFIKLCNKNLVSAVIIPGKIFSDMDKFKTFICGKNCSIDTPVIIAPEKTSCFTVAFYIQNYISEYYKLELKKIMEINNSFSHISLKTPDIKLIINYFNKVINNPVIIYDEFFNIIVSTDNYVHDYEEVQGTIEKNFLYNLYFYKQKILFKNDDVPVKECIRVLFPVTFEKRDKAYLAVFEVNTPMSSIDYTILEICATATLVEMKRILAIKKIEEKYLNDFLYDLIYRKDNKIDEIKRRAEILNIRENSDYCIIIFDLLFKDTYKPSKFSFFEDIRDKISDNIVSYFKRNGRQSLVSKFGKSIVIIHKINSNMNESYAEIKNMCEDLEKILVKKYDYIYIHIGIGSIIDNISDVSKSYHEALSSVSYGRTIYDENNSFIILYNDSSMLKLISKIKEKDLLYEIVPENLRELKKHDMESKSNLIETLSVYLDCNCNAKRASEKMFVHYKTIQYRLNKIFDDFNIDLQSSSSRLQTELGLQILSIMELQAPGESL